MMIFYARFNLNFGIMLTLGRDFGGRLFFMLSCWFGWLMAFWRQEGKGGMNFVCGGGSKLGTRQNIL